ncbi:MAG TPA: pitrilysin family protein [Bacteroidota bacterium]|nr:pitrilysin family protein [Bacteroidota bacterium]
MNPVSFVPAVCRQPRQHRSSRVLSAALGLAFLALLLPFSLEAQPDRSGPPPLGPPPSLRLPPIQHLSLSNGIPVVLMEKHAVPLVQVNLLIRGGALLDPPGKVGLASLTAAMLTEGAGARNSLQFADAVDYLGADISASSGFSIMGIALHTPLEKLDSALALFADVVRRPLFPPDELARNRKERLTSLIQARDEPRSLAAVLFNRTLYDDHPYGRMTGGDAASLGSMTVDDLRKFHDGVIVPGNTTIIVVGDVTPGEMMPKLEHAFGDWRGEAGAAPAVPPIKQLAAKTLLFVDKPGAAQSVIEIGRVGVPRLTDDYYAIVVMNTILGGSFTSRLNQNLREKHGYTYGAGSRFEFRPLAGPFVAAASVQTAVTDSSLVEFMKELKGIREPIPASDVDRAKNYVALSFPGDFQSVAQVAAQLEELVIYNLPDDYFNRYIDRILAVSAADVERVARKYIDTDDLAFVIVGDRKEVGESVRKLNLAPAKFLTVEDVLGPAPVVEGGK